MRNRALKTAAALGGLVLATIPAGESLAGPVADKIPAVPSTLVPPAGNVLTSVFPATGVQIYTCTDAKWTLLEPAATLAGSAVTGRHRPLTAIHFRGPSWLSDQDGSLVEGMSPVSAPSDKPNSIPQLLITKKLTRGDGVFGGVTFIQRLATSGGVAPTTACTAGQTTAVPYRAVYRFFKAAS